MESVLFTIFLLLRALSISSSQESCTLSFNDSLDLQSCTEVHLDIDFIEINETIAVSGSSKILLQGLKNSSKVSCLSGAGVTFDHIDSLKIINIEFTNCGILHNVSDSSKIIFKSAISIYNSRNVTILNTHVVDSDGSGLVLMNNHMVNIEHSSFIGGSMKTNYSDFNDVSISGGGGIFIAFICSLSIKSLNFNSSYCKDSTVLIRYGHFIDNHAKRFKNGTMFSDSTSCIDNVFSGLNKGGGISLILRNTSMNNVIVLNSELKNNKAQWGGGFRVIVCSNATDNVINLQHSELESNSVAADRGGGGITAGFVGSRVIGNTVNVHSVMLTGNHALYGGGVSLFTYLEDNNTFNISNCTWKQNYAHYGAAFYASPQIKDIIGKNILPQLNFINCSFESNYIYSEDITGIVRRMGDGIVMATGYTVNFAGYVTFANNRNGSCIYATSSVVHFSTHTYGLFLNNTAWEGAGIALYGFSSIIASEQSHITFCNNSISDRGAAIYYYSIDKNAYIRTRTCFIQSSMQSTRKTVYFNFYGNKALKDSTYDNGVMRDDSIYASSLASCLSESNNHLTFYETANFNHYNVCKQNMIPILHANMSHYDYGEPDVSSIEREIEFDGNESTIINFIPGKKFEIPLKVMKYSSLKVNTPFHVSIRNHDNSNITLSKAYRYITGYSLRLKGCREDNATITLLESGFRKYSISFRVYALHCPPLYRLENGECVCHSTVDLIFVEFHKCNNSIYHASIRLGYWIDYTHAKNLTSNTCTERSFALLTSYCPLGYCSRGVDEDNYIELPNDTFSISICNFRKEQLCGKCEDGRAVFFHSESFKCGKTDLCHLGLLFYLLSEILPITLLFLFIIFFNISFTSGDLNGFIFFAQVYDTISNVGGSFFTHSDSYSKISVAIRLIYKLFNFDFFNTDELSFCLWNTPSTLDILVFKYVTVIYALVATCSRHHLADWILQ